MKQYLLPADGTEDNRWLLVFSVAVMLLVGNAAPKLPRNGVIGIRLPWTMRDEDTWRMAHRKLGYCAFPIALITLAGGLLIDSKIFAIGGLLAFALVPAGWSWLYDYRKRKG